MSSVRSAVRWIDSHHVAVVGTAFAIHLLIGLAIFADYGVHWDEMNNQRFGERWFEYYVQAVSERSLEPSFELVKHDYIHGPSFEMLLVAVERATGLQDSRSVILMRHAAVFLLFHLGAVSFFFLCRRLFNSWKLGLLGFVFLVLHPRIFAHAFYNSVDLPFLSFYIMAMLTSIKLLDENNPRAAALHAMVCALLITVRAQGAFVAICTFVFLTADFVVLRRTRLKRLLLNGAVFGLLLTILVYLMWPLLWPDPLGTIMQAGEHNKFVTDRPPPWYYNFVWIGVTTPLLILGLFVAGFGGWAFSAARELSGSAKSFYRRHRLMLLLMLLLVVPLILPAVLGTRLFGGWRHHYFVYPVIVVFSVYGGQALFRHLGTRFESARLAVTTMVLLVGLSLPAIFIVRAHPHQQVYGNALSGEDRRHARSRGALDYWGVSYRQLMEHLLENQTGRLKIAARIPSGRWNLRILNPEQRQRVQFTRKINGNAQYLITNFRHEALPYPMGHEIYSIEVQGERISALYKWTE